MNFRLVIGLTLASLVSTAGSSSANIDDTSAQILQRYGKPLSETRPHDNKARVDYIFLFEPFSIKVIFSDGRSVQEMYFPAPVPPAQGTSPQVAMLTDKQIDSLLDANSDGKQWKVAHTFHYLGQDHTLGDMRGILRAWILEDGERTAVGIGRAGETESALAIISKRWSDFEDHAKALSDAARKKESGKSATEPSP